MQSQESPKHVKALLGIAVDDGYFRWRFQTLTHQYPEPMICEHAYLSPSHSPPFSTQHRIFLPSCPHNPKPRTSISKPPTTMPAHNTTTIIDTTIITLAEAQTSPLSGWTIFWTTLSLTLACVTHPINSGVGYPPKHRRILHSFTPISLFDAVTLITEVGKMVWHTRGRLLQACAVVRASRLRKNGDPILQD